MYNPMFLLSNKLDVITAEVNNGGNTLVVGISKVITVGLLN